MIIYNENAAYPAQWLRNLCQADLIDVGTVIEDSIENLQPDIVRHARQFHAFAGIGVWNHALRLAKWPPDITVWTGSCPCQPFSQAGRGLGTADRRHLWPEWRRLIAECQPPVIFGEQVASPAGRLWFSSVRSDLEALGYEVGAADLCAASAGAPHVRQRLFFVAVDSMAHTNRTGLEKRQSEQCHHEPQREAAERSGRAVSGLEDSHVQRCEGLGLQLQPRESRQTVPETTGRGQARDLGDAGSAESGRNTGTVSCQKDEGEEQGFNARYISHEPVSTGATNGFWANCDWVYCRPEPSFPSGSYRPIEPSTFPLADRVAGRVAVHRASGPSEETEEHRYNRRGALEAIGNAIVPHVAAAFVTAAMSAIADQS